MSSENHAASIGLCGSCAHAKRVTSAKGSEFWLCGKSEQDPRFPKYPRLPVLRCSGYEASPEAAPHGHQR